jgi:type II secretory pathway pseudopilin PulG
MISVTLETDQIGRHQIGNQTMKTYKNKPGLTLMEMVIVVGVVMLMSTIVIMLVGRIENQTKENQLKNIFGVLDSALQEYNEYWNSFPDPNKIPYTTSSAALYGQLYSTPSCRNIVEQIDQSFIRNSSSTADLSQIYDPWGTILKYKYTAGDNFPELISAGPDKIFGTTDDVINKQ